MSKTLKNITYVMMSFIVMFSFNSSVFASTTGTVVVDSYLNVRNMINGNSVAKLTNGTVVTITDLNAGSNSLCNNWYKVTYGNYNSTGYACGDYITLLKGYASCVENRDPVNIWKDTNKSSKIKTVDKKEIIFIVLSGIATGVSWLAYYKALQVAARSLIYCFVL